MRNMGSSSLPDTLHLCGCLVMSFGNPDSHWYHSFLNFTERYYRHPGHSAPQGECRDLILLLYTGHCQPKPSQLTHNCPCLFRICSNWHLKAFWLSRVLLKHSHLLLSTLRKISHLNHLRKRKTSHSVAPGQAVADIS